ncbi:DUF115 domain-containing protein [Candidatus Magnetomoraceae bacterium gMMP-15]
MKVILMKRLYDKLLNFKRYKYKRDTFFENTLNKIVDVFERDSVFKMRSEGKLLFLSELIPLFENTKLFAFGNGGSVANLKNIEKLNNYNLISVHNGPFHLHRMYGFVPNIWYLHFGPSARVILEDEKNNPLDFSETFILIPANDSPKSAVHFSSPIIKKFRKKHPEATYVLYRELRYPLKKPPENYLSKGIEPLYMKMGGETLQNQFIPFCAYLGVSTLYFSGIDNLPTGHFYDRNRPYQTIDGKLLDFQDKKIVLKSNTEIQSICSQKNINIFRLEKKETIFQSYQFIEFEKALENATLKITPSFLSKTEL